MKKIIFYDGKCGMCDSFVHFVYQRDTKGQLYFAPLQGKTAKKKLPKEYTQKLKTIVFFDANIYVKTSAVLRILSHLGWWYKPLLVFLVVPPFLRNGVYEIVSRHRYRLFASVCSIDHQKQKRFLP